LTDARVQYARKLLRIADGNDAKIKRVAYPLRCRGAPQEGGANAAVDIREMTAQHFEESWRVGCFAGFLFGREAVRRLSTLGRGTVIFTGASGSLRGKPRFAAFNATKGGLRLLVQSLAREFGPQGIHVAHAIIDGGIEGERLLSRLPDRKEKAGADGLLNIEAIADSYWHLHRQHRSAWTHEIDLRPYKEPF
jgi:NAD(P)-dependent dehydrogenase (short-subunit alcohol dehydrogenase family)